MSQAAPSISIIIPTLDEAGTIDRVLAALKEVRGQPEVIAVDGGSQDRTVDILRSAGVRVIHSERGRGRQLHAGALVARGDVFWFLHADTLPPADGTLCIREALEDKGMVGGNFRVRFDGELWAARFLTWLYPQLGRLGLYYGDSGIFVRADVYRKIGGFKPFPIFEDFELVRQLKLAGRLAHLTATVTTSSRRFEGRSFALTFARWAFLQTLYWLGVSPHALGRMYAPVRRDEG